MKEPRVIANWAHCVLQVDLNKPTRVPRGKAGSRENRPSRNWLSACLKWGRDGSSMGERKKKEKKKNKANAV